MRCAQTMVVGATITLKAKNEAIKSKHEFSTLHWKYGMDRDEKNDGTQKEEDFPITKMDWNIRELSCLEINKNIQLKQRFKVILNQRPPKLPLSILLDNPCYVFIQWKLRIMPAHIEVEKMVQTTQTSRMISKCMQWFYLTNF